MKIATYNVNGVNGRLPIGSAPIVTHLLPKGRFDSTMPTFRLEYKEDMHGVAKYLDFEALDAGGALKFAKLEAHGRWARLSENGHFLCALEHLDRGDSNLWVISSGERQLP